VFGNPKFKKEKTRRIKRDKKALQAKIHNHYVKKRMLCEKCDLCRLSVEEIEENYDDILQRITVEEK
jgi:ribosomal protein L34E